MGKVISGKSLITFLLTTAIGLALIGLKATTYIKVEQVMAYYGDDEPASQLIVDKRIKAVSISEWQDNISSSEIVLKESDLVEFEIVVKNTGNTELKNIDVKDYLPSYLKFIFGPNSPEGQDINWKIDQLDKGEEKSFQIRTQIENTDQASEGTFCLMNKATARAESGEYDEDTASFCLIGAKKLPKAGAGNLVAGTIIASLIGTAGFILRKFGRGEILA